MYSLIRNLRLQKGNRGTLGDLATNKPKLGAVLSGKNPMNIAQVGLPLPKKRETESTWTRRYLFRAPCYDFLIWVLNKKGRLFGVKVWLVKK